MLRFRLGRIPVRVHLMFGVTALILWQLSGQQSAETLAIWVVIMFLGVLMHELGHALAGLRFGLKPNIELQGMGGVTWWSGGPALSPWRSIVVSFAGPLVGIVLGGLGIFYARSQDGSLVGGGYEAYALQSFIWVNLGWGLLNLIPMLPLDGGNIMRSLLQWISPSKGRVWADGISMLVGLALMGLCFMAGQYIMACLIAYLLYQNWQAGKQRKQSRADANLEPAFREVVEALHNRRFEEAATKASRLQGEAKSLGAQAAAAGLLAWSRFGQGDLDGAQEAVDSRPRGAPLDAGLQGAILLKQEEPELALRHLEGAMHSSSDPQIPELLCIALIQVGRGEEVCALLDSGADARMHPGAIKRLSQEARRVDEPGLAVRIAKRLQ